MRQKKTLVLAMFLIVSLMLAACTQSNNNTEASGSGEASGTSETVGSSSQPIDENVTWDSPNLSWKKDTTPTSMTAYMDYTWWPMDSWGNDEVSQEITKRTGMTLDITKASDENQLQVMIASNELPCLVYTANPAFEKYFEDPKVSFAYDELIEKYAPEFMQLLDPEQVFLNTSEDGHFYRIRSHYTSEAEFNDPKNVPGPGMATLHFRQDIYNELGNPPMKTLDDIINVFKMVKEKYPDMIPYLPNWIPFMEYMGFQSTPKSIGDKVTIGLAEPGAVAYYEYMNELYRNGLIPKEYMSYKYEQFLEVVRSGKVFAASYNASFSDEQNKFFDTNNIKGKWTPLNTPPTVNGEMKMKRIVPSGGWSNLYITKSCPDPARAIKYFEFLKSPEGDSLAQWGIEGVHYTLTEDGLLKRPESFQQKTIQQAGVGPNYGLWNFGASGYREGIVNASIANSDPKYATSVTFLKAMKPYISQDMFINFTNPKSGSDEGVIQTKINQIILRYEPKMITAKTKEQVDEVYNEMLEDMKKTGLPKLEEYMTAEYNKAKQKYSEFVQKTTNS
ncbi:hypothetical protein [Paenibacillus nasutitermitis]|uniref:ABC transporter substrate-binding protein n=1 Tax=Paenibacillus nasutitermitis TaxID=1652958 RepID=A0A916ZEG7_9BACL|nr:hypothetical protein [Paenibacillus nasutitermitis]GGD89773.1 ABC transporter substrate-binding protein [Paenibacillus nasutitermitis]